MKIIDATRCWGDLVRVVIAVAARTALWTVLLLAAWSTVPAAIGWHVTTVASGSMTPAVLVGDVVAAMPADPSTVAEGHVVLADHPDHPGRLLLHRVHRVDADGMLHLRGDANPAPDRSAVHPSAVHGIGVLRFPVVGLPGTWTRTGAWSSLLAAGGATAVLALLARADRHVRRAAPCSGCGAPRWTVEDGRGPSSATAVGTVGQSSTAVVAVSSVLLVVAVLATAGATASFTAATGTGSAVRTQEFPCFRKPLDGAVLAWDFDEARGTGITDRSGSGQHATATAHAERVDAGCEDNPYLTFQDTPDDPRAYSEARVTGPTVFSIETWFRTTNAGGSIMSFGSHHTAASSDKDRRFFLSPDGRLVFGVQGNGGSRFRFQTGSSARVDDGRWHHAVGTARAGRMELWLDGAFTSSRADLDTPLRYDGYWRVGRESTANWNQAGLASYVGDVDSVRVYDRILDATTITEHHRAGR